MRDFSLYDARNYDTASVTEGYAEWARTYDQKMLDMMDRSLLSRLDVAWRGEAIDLACGTGRVGAWLVEQGVAAVDGVDLTPEMLAKARARGVYRRLEVRDVTDTKLEPGYDLAIQVLADEHVRDLGALYAEAARLVPSGTFVLIGYHPYFMLNGVPTHFQKEDGSQLAIRQYVHLTSDHINAGLRAGFSLAQMEEAVVDEVWFEARPRWKKYEGWPITFGLVWSAH